MVTTWTGRESRLLRVALRLTVRAFAEDLGVSPRTISKWEQAGPAITPRPELQAALDTMLGRATAEEQQRFVAAAAPDGEQPTSLDISPMPPSRSTAPYAAVPVGMVGTPRMSVEQIRQVAGILDDARHVAEAELAAHFTSCIGDCQSRDGDQGPLEALPSTLGVIAAIETVAREVGLPVRRDLLTLAARGAEFTGWLYRDAGSLDQATYWYDRAMEWAQEAHNPAMQGYVLLRKSQLAYDGRDGIRVLSLAEAAACGPWQLPPRVQAEVAQQQALGLGMLDRPPDAVERQLDDARALLGQAVEGDEGSQLLGATFTASTLRLRSTASSKSAAGL